MFMQILADLPIIVVGLIIVGLTYVGGILLVMLLWLVFDGISFVFGPPRKLYDEELYFDIEMSRNDLR